VTAHSAAARRPDGVLNRARSLRSCSASMIDMLSVGD
jgi:hypothetical protein